MHTFCVLNITFYIIWMNIFTILLTIFIKMTISNFLHFVAMLRPFLFFSRTTTFIDGMEQTMLIHGWRTDSITRWGPNNIMFLVHNSINKNLKKISKKIRDIPGSNVKMLKSKKILWKRKNSPFYGQFLSDKKNSMQNSPFLPS